MRNKLHYKRITAFVLFFFIQGVIYAQGYSASESLSMSAAVPENIKIVLSNSSAGMAINTTNKKQVSINTKIKVTGKTKEDVNKLISAIKDFEFERHGGSFEINTRFYKNIMSNGSRTTMTLLNGEKIKVREFEIHHELSIPKSASLEFKNKYSNIELNDIEGEVKLNLYSSKINAGNFQNKATLEMKYSKAYLGKLQNVKLDLYDSDIIFEGCKDIDIESKYSKIEGGNVANINMVSYDDKLTAVSATNIFVNSKYSDFEINSGLNEVKLDLYDSNFSAGETQKCSYKGKYSELKLKNISELGILSSYDDIIYLGNTKKINIAESKYTDYNLGQVDAFYLEGHEDNITGELTNGFKGPIDIKGKYIKIVIDSNKQEYQVNFNIKHPKVDLPGNVEIIKHIKENSHLELKGNNTGGAINIEGYEIKVQVK